MRRMKMGRRPARGRRIWILLILLAAWTLFLAESRLPAIKAEIQQATLSAWGQERVAETIQTVLPQTPAANGETLVSLDTYALSTLKTELTTALQEALTGKARAWVPVGNLTGWTMLNGHGFKIPVTFSVEGVVSVSFESSLTAAGINRTKYAVQMTVTAQLYSSSTAFPDAVTLTTAYPVYESVLEGEVPRYAAGLAT